MSNLEKNVESILSRVESIPNELKTIHKKIDSIDQKITPLQIEVGITKNIRKEYDKKFSTIKTIFILILASFLGFTWFAIEQWLQTEAKYKSIISKIDQD